jgi:negative regulator of flagellin synthesis FlgM
VKINPNIPAVTANDPARAKPGAQGVRKSGSASEQVELSSLATSVQDASAALADTPVVDAARVAEIKQAISDGRFQINPDRVADGLIESVRQMLARQQG